MSAANRPLTFTADPALQQLIAALEARLQLNRSALVAQALVELARREGVPIPPPERPRRPGWRRPQGRLIADPPGPIGGRRTRL